MSTTGTTLAMQSLIYLSLRKVLLKLVTVQYISPSISICFTSFPSVLISFFYDLVRFHFTGFNLLKSVFSTRVRAGHQFGLQFDRLSPLGRILQFCSLYTNDQNLMDYKFCSSLLWSFYTPFGIILLSGKRLSR